MFTEEGIIFIPKHNFMSKYHLRNMSKSLYEVKFKLRVRIY